jgi:hypothetical protein
MAIAIGGALLALGKPYLPVLAGLGVSVASVGDAAFALIPAFATFGLPMIFFRLEHPRGVALARVFGCFFVTLAVATAIHPAFRSAGGATRFFADTMVLGIYTVVLIAAFRVGRPRARPRT